jgi:hypothetical protein
MAYADGIPFTTTLTQKINVTQTYTVTRVYDGLGRQTKITSDGVIVDTIYDSATVTHRLTAMSRGKQKKDQKLEQK